MGIWLGPLLFLLGCVLGAEPFIFVSMVLTIVPITEYNDVKHPADKVVSIAALRLYFCIVSYLIAQFAAFDLQQIVQRLKQGQLCGGSYYVSISSFLISVALALLCTNWLSTHANADAAAAALAEADDAEPGKNVEHNG